MTLACLFSLIFFIACCIYVLLAIYVLLLDTKSPLNRLFCVLCISLGLWTFGYSIANCAPDLETAYFWRRVAAAGWGPLFSILLHCLLILTERDSLLKRKWLYFLLYLPGAVTVFVFGLHSGLAGGQYNLVNTAAGWINISSRNLWDWFFNIYYAGYTVIAVWMLWDWGLKTADADKKKQSRWLILSFVFVIAASTITDIISNLNQQLNLPQIGSLTVLLPVSIIFYFIKKYGFLKPRETDPETSLDEVNLAVFYRIISMAFLLGSMLHFASRYFVYHIPLQSVLLFSAFLFIYGIIFLLIHRFSPRKQIHENVFLLLICVSIPIVILWFRYIAGVTVWAFPFLFLILSAIYKRRMLLWVSVSVLFTLIFMWVSVPAAKVQINGTDHVIRIGFFAIAIWLTFYINRLYMHHLKENEAQIRFQKVVSLISAEFVKATEFNLKEKTDEMLKICGEYLKLDYAVFLSSSAILPTRHWYSKDLEGEVGVLPEFYGHDFPWWDNCLQKSGVLQIPDVDLLPPEADAEKALFKQNNIKSLMAITVTVKGSVSGCLFFASTKEVRNWRKDHREMLRILANLLSDALSKAESAKEISYMAYYDSLTGLPNRSSFKFRLQNEILLARKNKKLIAVMFIDLDSFKAVNDTIGHDGGDKILKMLTPRLSAQLRSSDYLARFGGDEFLIQFNQLERMEDIPGIAERIMNTFTLPFSVKDQEFFITASAGIAVYPADGEDADILIKNADLAMYTSKEMGKNQYTLCSPVMKEEVLQKMKLTNSLYRVLAKNELLLLYQPQINIESREIIGFEALLRWNHPDLGLIKPGSFIGLAEHTGLIHQIGIWALETACRQNSNWQLMGFPPLRIAVNLSVEQFRSPKLVSLIGRILNETGLEARYLELEITESMAIREADYFIRVLQELKELGITIALDDFGTEYSSLSRLKALPVDRIKIDMQFVHGLAVNKKDEAITRTIIQLANNLELGVIAEGVENEAQLDFFRQQKCYEVQGYYFYKPMPAAEAEALLVHMFSKKNDAAALRYAFRSPEYPV
jgi:diguanylate cyclase (GGDEF)-like protein